MGNSCSTTMELATQNQRFILVPAMPGWHAAIVVLNGYQYWDQHWEELRLWLQDYPKVEIQGMTLDFPDTTDLTMFLLKWSP